MIVAIDTDPGVDDALALMLALRSPELDVRLITTVAGNVTVHTATKNARRLIRFIAPTQQPLLAEGASAPMARALTHAQDVHGNDGLGGMTKKSYRSALMFPIPRDLKAHKDGVSQLIDLVRSNPHQVTIIALGPLTNIALAIQKSPRVMRKLKRLVIMGGAVQVPGNITPSAEFNFYVDPEAAHIVLHSKLPITLIPLDVTRKVRLEKTHLNSTATNKLTRATRLITESIRARYGAVSMHDPLAVAVAINPDFVKTTSLWVGVECSSQISDGASPGQAQPWRGNQNAAIDVALEVDAQAVLSFFNHRVLAGNKPGSHTSFDQPQVAVVGSANIDLSAKTSHLPLPGETVIGAQVSQGFGGKGANQAIAANRAGARVTFACSLGTDAYGDSYRSLLHREGIKAICRRTSEPTGLALISVNRHGENSITVASGANDKLDRRTINQIDLSNSSVMVLQLEVPLPTVLYALQRAKTHQVTTLLNAAPAMPLDKSLLALVDVLIVNAVEAQALSRRPVTTISSAHSVCRKLGELGIANVVITLGNRGAVALDETREPIRVPALKTDSVDSTGAGDTFVGYTATALAEGLSLDKALRFAATASALSVKHRGAVESIPRRDEVQRLMARRTKR